MATDRSPLDCRGLACPEPVLQTKTALDALGAEGILTVLVDSEASRDNVKRFAESQGSGVSSSPLPGGGWQVAIAKGYPCAVTVPLSTVSSPTGQAEAFLVTNDGIGVDPDLGKVLMRAFLGTIGKADVKPRKILFLNRGVHLTTEGAESLDILKELEAGGVEIMSCGTCLDFFHLKDALRVGRISNMYETVEILAGPGKVVTVS